MTELEPLLNVIFSDGGKEYRLSEMENKPYFQKCYYTASIMVKPIIKIINDSDTFVKIDLTSADHPIFSLINISEEVREGLTKFKISI
jgi:hypothetical protein